MKNFITRGCFVDTEKSQMYIIFNSNFKFRRTKIFHIVWFDAHMICNKKGNTHKSERFSTAINKCFMHFNKRTCFYKGQQRTNSWSHWISCRMMPCSNLTFNAGNGIGFEIWTASPVFSSIWAYIVGHCRHDNEYLI